MKLCIVLMFYGIKHNIFNGNNNFCINKAYKKKKRMKYLQKYLGSI